MSQQNQYPYGGSQQQQQQQQGGSQQPQSGQPMTPEQYAAYQAYLARGASGVPGYPQTPAAGGWPAGYAQNAQGYPAAPQGQSAYPATGGHHVASYAQQRLAGQHVTQPLRPGTPVRPGTPGLSAHVQPPGSRHIYAAYPPPAPPATPAPMPTDDKPFPCDYCSRTFARQHDLRRHVETHSGDKPYACSFPGCTHAYTRKDALKRHQDASNHHV